MAEFSWAAAGDVGLGLLGGLTKGASAYSAAQGAKAQAELSNALRDSQNMVKRSQARLAYRVREINNARIMRAGASRLESTVLSGLRQQDAFVAGSFEQSIADAEQAGAAAAAAAASGVGGAGIEAIGQTVALTNARRGAYTQRRYEQYASDTNRAAREVIPAALESLELGPISLGQDYRRDVVPQGGLSGLAAGLIEGLFSKKDSLQVLLGSLAPGRAPVSDAIPSVSPATGAWSWPVSSSTVVGVDLPPINLK